MKPISNGQAERRGEMADRLLNDPLLVETMASMERDCFEAFCSTRYSEADKRQELWALMNNAKKFRATLSTYVMHGEHAKKEIEKQQTAKRGTWRSKLAEFRFNKSA